MTLLKVLSRQPVGYKSTLAGQLFFGEDLLCCAVRLAVTWR
jgi:hypothetical protein